MIIFIIANNQFNKNIHAVLFILVTNKIFLVIKFIARLCIYAYKLLYFRASEMRQRFINCEKTYTCKDVFVLTLNERKI